MSEHKLKIKDEFWRAVHDGDKTFEMRYNDRGYQKGDTIIFMTEDGQFARNDNEYQITYVLNGWGLNDNYVAFCFKLIRGQAR